MVVTVEDEELHRSHFVARTADSATRPIDRYLNGFQKIRKVQKYIKSQALARDWPVVSSYNLDQTIASAIELVVEAAMERTGATAPSVEQSDEKVLELRRGTTP
jgi:2-phosphoglycerate kinase